jgi:hypothetical protein
MHDRSDLCGLAKDRVELHACTVDHYHNGKTMRRTASFSMRRVADPSDLPALTHPTTPPARSSTTAPLLRKDTSMRLLSTSTRA